MDAIIGQGGDEIQEKVIKIIADQLATKTDKISATSVLVDDLGADSLDVVEMVMSLEDEFHVTFQDDQYEKIKTVSDVVEYVKTAKAEKK